MRVLVAMSGGVDSSVAAALLVEAGHDVVGATLKLWGGPSDSGCCSVADVEDARRVAGQLGIDHHVFNLTEAFEDQVVRPYVADHAAGRTPNPCVECNRSIKFGRLLERSRRLGFDALATGHHARIVVPGSRAQLRRGADRAKDQSYVLAMLDGGVLEQLLLPVGDLTKHEVRSRAAALGLRTAGKPDSQDVCFIYSATGRRAFLEERIDLHPASLVDAGTGRVVGEVPAGELVTVGQRRGLGVAVDGRRRYALAVDTAARRITVGPADQAVARRLAVVGAAWSGPTPPPGARALAQTSAHAPAGAGRWLGDGVLFDQPQPLVAPGQTVAFYDPGDPDAVLGAATAGRAP
ncbi:MAG TPA: tRNA 2-thiouridine(34) synthase MnmA [Acidimicrobiales bacterium]|nr:tRNA 2-thiouridine(34) synthase MnmA [Acidimicrobiales bacterium]